MCTHQATSTNGHGECLAGERHRHWLAPVGIGTGWYRLQPHTWHSASCATVDILRDTQAGSQALDLPPQAEPLEDGGETNTLKNPIIGEKHMGGESCPLASCPRTFSTQVVAGRLSTLGLPSW